MSGVTKVPMAYRGAAEKAPRPVRGGRFAADVDAEETVVFLVGMRINRLRRVRSWWPVFSGMPRMLKELEADPGSGLLGARSFLSGRVLMVVQYWRSVEDLGRFAKDPSLSHHPAWVAFNRAAAGSGDVGVFHETYVVSRDAIESLYGNMPPFGLGDAYAPAPGHAVRRSRAQDRMGQREPAYG